MSLAWSWGVCCQNCNRWFACLSAARFISTLSRI